MSSKLNTTWAVTLCLAGAVAFANAIAAAPIAMAQTTPQAPAYTGVAHWLFDLYINQSVQLTVVNTARARPGAGQVLAPQMPAMARVLGRHRDTFVAAMQLPLRGQFGDREIQDLLARVGRDPPDLDDAARSRLIAVDQEFRRESQAVIRAITHDLGLIVAETLGDKSGATGALR